MTPDRADAQKDYLMKLKLDDAGNAVLVDGKPVYVADDGKEFPIDGGQLYGRVRDLTTENANHRKAKEDAEGKLKAFEGIDDPEAARKALETVANIDAGQLVAAGKVEEIKAGAKKAAEEQIAAAMKKANEDLGAAKATITDLEGALHKEIVGGNFARSKYIADKIAVPADIMQAMFGAQFKVEDGKLAAYDATGIRIPSIANPGEMAGFDEAMEAIVSAYPNRDAILRGQVGAGGGAGHGGGTGGAKSMARSQFEKLPPADQMAKMKEGFTLTEA